MASAKKKLDEYHLKILRQFLSLPANKECFDCHQRGPTYVNVTIGSFVCTTCSGMLRGLTPPHRVKSISMATFTPEEIDFVKARGNDYCRRTWLGLLDAERPSKDEQQIKDFMIAKYERKRYYVDPSIASTLSKAVNGDVQTQPKPCFPRVAQPHPATLAFKPPSKTIGNSSAFTPEPFADFSKLSIPPPCDPFNSSQAAAAPSSSQLAFADFDNNPVFSNSTSSGVPGVGEAGTVPGEDRYAALKDLDCLMKSQQQAPEPTADWNTGVANGSSAWPASTHSNSATVNPFKGGGMWGAGANPFRTEAKLVSAETVWPQVSNGQVSNGFPTSQSLNFAAPKVPWNNDSISNPFVVGTSPHTMSHHSSNPFL